MVPKTQLTRFERAYFAPIAGYAVALAVYTVIFVINQSTQLHQQVWLLAIVGAASLAVGGIYRLVLGSITGVPPIGFVVALLAAINFVDQPMFAVGLFACGLYVSYLINLRNPVLAVYAAGVASGGALSFVWVSRALLLAGWWPVACFLVGSAAHIATILVIEFVRQKGQWGRDNSFGVSALRVPRLLLLVAMCTIGATFVFSLTHQYLPLFGIEQDILHAVLVMLLAAFVFLGLSTRAHIAQTVRRLDGLVNAAITLPANGSNASTEMLADLVRTTIEADGVEIRETPAGPNEISSRIMLESAREQHIVAKRKVSATPFTPEDLRVLEALAHIGSEAVRTKQSVDILTQEANTDPLTGLPNYRAFQETLARINDNRSYSEAIAVLFIDVDDFKFQNDRYGHHAGDVLLKALAERMLATVRPGDSVSRVGGDEFVIILVDLSSLAEAKAIADRVVASSGVPVNVDDTGLELIPVISVGLAYSAHRESDVDALVIDADRSMLEIKKARRNGGHRAESSVSISAHRSSRINDIVARAVDQNLLTVVFQPIVSMVENRIWGFEALVRYTDAELGPISPSSLVDKAKRLGRMNKLTEQVINKAMIAATRFVEIQPTITVMAANLEAKQILSSELGDFLHGIPKRFPAATMCLELNERSVGLVSDELRMQANSLRDRGMMIALDDYGSENSSVGALVRLPMDILKIDRSLVDDLDDIRQQEIIKALQGFGDTLDYSIIVEGIEDLHTAERLQKLGVRSVQGFFYGRPITFEATIERLRKHGTAATVDDAAFAADEVSVPHGVGSISEINSAGVERDSAEVASAEVASAEVASAEVALAT